RAMISESNLPKKRPNFARQLVQYLSALANLVDVKPAPIDTQEELTKKSVEQVVEEVAGEMGLLHYSIAPDAAIKEAPMLTCRQETFFAQALQEVLQNARMKGSGSGKGVWITAVARVRGGRRWILIGVSNGLSMSDRAQAGPESIARYGRLPIVR